MKNVPSTLEVIVTEKMQVEPDLINYDVNVYSKAYKDDYYPKIDLGSVELATYENLMALAQSHQANLVQEDPVKTLLLTPITARNSMNNSVCNSIPWKTFSIFMKK